ncbi:hypothetical protein ABZV34_14160 [Streptomyces sp. NPDC005195]|uniref:hypothetical protein n=1 Tax=Streptomyces sp. NPDC005195 TaxID=3154561 RepID=UPI0033AE3B6A
MRGAGVERLARLVGRARLAAKEGPHPLKPACGITVWGHDGCASDTQVRTAADADDRPIPTSRVNTDKIADPGLEPALLSAEFHTRTH